MKDRHADVVQYTWEQGLSGVPQGPTCSANSSKAFIPEELQMLQLLGAQNPPPSPPSLRGERLSPF